MGIGRAQGVLEDQTMGTQLITAVTAVASLIIGALLQHFLGSRADAKRQRSLLRATAYADFLRGVSALAATHHTDATSRDHYQALVRVGDARARIALYGSAATVKAAAEIADYPVRLTSQLRVPGRSRSRPA